MLATLDCKHYALNTRHIILIFLALEPARLQCVLGFYS